MTNKQKDIVIKGVIIPVIIAVLLSVLVIISLRFNINIPYSNAKTEFATISTEEISEISSFEGNVGETISKAELSEINSNTIIGSVFISDTSYPLIYNASDVNAMGKLNITGKKVIGEVGTVFIEIFKNESAKVKLLNNGDVISINTFYNEYEYKVIDTFVARNDYQLKNAGTGVGSAVAIYVDNSVGIGMSNEKFVVLCELTSGTPVVE